MKQSNAQEFVCPSTPQEAVEAFAKAQGKAVYLAGATDVFADSSAADTFIDITEVGLNYITEQGDHICIGAGTTFSDIIASPLMQEKCRVLFDAAKVLADRTIRNVATFAGNLASALPSGDAIPTVYVADADIILLSCSGERSVKGQDFFTGPRTTVLQEGELIKEIRVPACCAAQSTGTAFEKIARNSVDIAVANAGAFVSVNGKQEITDIRIALGAVGPTVMRATKAEAALQGVVLNEENLAAALEKIAGDIAPIDNLRSSAEYRFDVSKALVKRAVLRAYNQACNNA